MIAKSIGKAMNRQLLLELGSAYFYLNLAARLDTMKYPGAAHYMREQSKDELKHAEKFYGFLNDCGWEIGFEKIEKPETADLNTPLDVFKSALKHETEVTGRINKLSETAISENDFGAFSFLRDFSVEQVSEEKEFHDAVDRLEAAAGSVGAMLFLDGGFASMKKE